MGQSRWERKNRLTGLALARMPHGVVVIMGLEQVSAFEEISVS